MAVPPRRLHSLYLLPPLPWPQLWDKRGSRRNHEADRAPRQPAPFTTPLGLQTVTLATNLSEASSALAGPGRGALSLEPPLSGPAPRARPRPWLPRRALPLGHVLGPPLLRFRLHPLVGLRLRLRGLVRGLRENGRRDRGIGPRHGAQRPSPGQAPARLCSGDLSGVGPGCLTAWLGNEGYLERVGSLFFGSPSELPPRSGCNRPPFRSHAEEALACWLVMNCPGLWMEIRGWLQFKLSPPQHPLCFTEENKATKRDAR